MQIMYSTVLVVVVIVCVVGQTFGFAPQHHGYGYRSCRFLDTKTSTKGRNIYKENGNARHGRDLAALGGAWLWDAIRGGRKVKPVPENIQCSASTAVQGFINSWNQGDVDEALTYFAPDCNVDFVNFFEPCEGLESLERRLRLLQNAEDSASFDNKLLIVVDKLVSDERAVGIKFHLEKRNSAKLVSTGRGSAFFLLNGEKIKDVFWVEETSSKDGENGLKVLREASTVIEKLGGNPVKSMYTGSSEASAVKRNNKCAPLEYFASWNRRDMNAAVDCFDENITYDDTAFPNPFKGKEELRKHLNLCASCFPNTFSFVVDDFVDAGDTVCVKWHVENRGEPLPFTRGCSFYEINPTNGKIRDGIDFLEPAVFKPGGVELFSKSLKGKIMQEPARIVPLVVWVAYIGIVFFSDGILPGANALALEQRTWEEVRDLSLNFFLVSPILGLPFSPVVHPMLEGEFNLLLSWAAMFAGFLSDDRKDKPNLFPMLPAVVGMQFLTSAFLLPYLAIRSTERRTDLSKEDLSSIAKACESPLLGILMGAMGSLSTGWALLGRQVDFGSDLAVRWSSFVDLLSIDRVGSSFLVDSAIFGLFQFWLIDDDMKRRGASGQSQILVALSKYVPFFGMAAYLALRPSLPETSAIARTAPPSEK